MTIGNVLYLQYLEKFNQPLGRFIESGVASPWSETFYINESTKKRVSTGSKFPAVFFLDSRVFRYGQIEIPKTTITTPLPIVNFIGDTNKIRIFASQYFDSIHGALPFISKKRFYLNLLNPLAQPRADVSLLLLCMKLITWSPSESNGKLEGPQTAAYFMAKRFVLEIETAGILTVPVLQACILLTIYEIGHAIYPSAYISIGACVRHSSALGIHGREVEHVTDTSLWIEQEERKRVWWAVIIIDRF